MECVVNVSEGRRQAVIDLIALSCAGSLLDVHSDPDYDRSVFTLAGPRVYDDVQRLVRRTVELVDFGSYHGIHPALGTLDVIPFVPLGAESLSLAVELRDRLGEWLAGEFDLPVFIYGEEISLPEVRRGAFSTVVPTWGASKRNARLGAACVGARRLLVALNINLGCSASQAKVVAKAVRSPQIRTLALVAGSRIQVSMNLTDPLAVTPLMAVDLVASMAPVESVELVGLLPEAIVVGYERRYAALGIDPEATIEARLRRQVTHP
ncbi:MAG: hypothetical protein ACYCWN_06080 [Ferrimicrobium sp.]|jgi:glutamate formiminotransferase|uniref:glutamate formimidoyltransferase n=1 Tax=Ferrimicrobium acidiphilum TaxID=121039 RepID=A0ABV3Y5X9_9ACTN|nr:hypothetical protein [Ferrimicrobium sp.]